MDVYHQLAHLQLRLDKDLSMIDPVEFGEIKGAVASLQAQMTDFKARQAVVETKVDLVLEKLSEAKGGWRTLMWLGGAASSFGAAIGWFASQLKG
jgi:hypothetical protein